MGRMMRAVKTSKSRELWDHAEKGGFAVVTGIDLDAYVSKHSTVLDVVAFRIDTQAWLDSLTENQRHRALDLAEGDGTNELASRWNVSAPAVPLYRRQLNEGYERFMNP